MNCITVVRLFFMGLVLSAVGNARAEEAIAAKEFTLPEHLEATLWAQPPAFFNPTNIDVDERGRVWVAEAVNYRNFTSKNDGRLTHAKGDRIVILEDTDGDGKADKSTLFVQDRDLVAPLGIAVFGNRVIVSCSPSLIMYTDVNRNGRFEPGVDKKQKLLTGFGGLDHDHGLHAAVAGPDGRWYFTVGNAGSHTVTDRAGWTLRAGGWYTGGTPYNTQNTPGRKSDDGRVYVGGLAMGINPDGTGLSVYAHNFRNNYEVCLDSFGNVFQNDNDDQTASCRTTWLMQYANAGYSSADGKRSWQADKRPGQSIPIAHWHQEDPGVIPSGDLYGAGAPTGMVVYESDALGKEFRGMLLSCEAGRNVVLGYHVQPRGAGFDLRRFPFFSSGLADDPDYKWSKLEQDRRKWFRPSDVAVGTDGAIYVADWFDPIIGGHAMHDKVGTGAIYRIAPKGRKLPLPKIDLNTTAGRIAALSSPAPNVRFLGFEALLNDARLNGAEQTLAALETLRTSNNLYVRARAVWLTAQLGDAGSRAVVELLKDDNATTRVVALRALRRAGADPLKLAGQLAGDPSPAVRREVALILRDVPLEKCETILLKLAAGFDGRDRWYLEAFGTACAGKEDALYPKLRKALGAPPMQWDDRFAGLVWRLHPTGAVEPLAVRAMSGKLDDTQRKQAIDALAFIPDRSAAVAMIEVASRGPSDLRRYASWWVDFRRHNLWHDHADVLRNVPSAQRPPSEVAGVTLPGQPVYSSEVIRRGDVAEISADVTGAKRLYLVVTDAGDGNSCDWADWAEPRLVGPQGEMNLTSFHWSKATTGYGRVLVDSNCKGLPLRINGRSVPAGIGTHASSVIVYDIAGKNFEQFKARGGLDNGRKDLGGTDYRKGAPSILFHVYHDGPTQQERVLALEQTLLDRKAAPALREKSAVAMTRSKLGGMRLLSLASTGKLPEELRSVIAQNIHRNPDLSVRALAGQHFPRTATGGHSLPPLAKLAKIRGDAHRGQKLAFDRAKCATCHTFDGQGKSIGPDLTGIGRRLDRTRLLDSIVNPSASISFGFELWLIVTDDGLSLSGFIVGEGDLVLLKDAKGKQHTIRAETIEFRKRQSVSLMPEIASLELTAQDLADIVEFLIHPPATK